MSNLESYRKKTDAQLLYIIKDAGEAAQAMRGVSKSAEAKYLDQVNDASTVMYERRNGKRTAGVALNAATRLTADHHDEHLEKILNAINHSGIKSNSISSEGQEIVVLTPKAFNVHMLEKFAQQMHVGLEHIVIEPGHGGTELRIPAFVIGK